MSDDEIKDLLSCAIQTLIIQDKWLLEKNLSERSITHKLAEYLQPLFREYDVDCEYNGNIEHKSQKKCIEVLKSELQDIQINLTKKELANIKDDFTERAVFPDIIIHKRGFNTENICIIEVKKTDCSPARRKFDELKLRKYTSGDAGRLKYQLGVYIEFGINDKYPEKKLDYYADGNELK